MKQTNKQKKTKNICDWITKTKTDRKETKRKAEVMGGLGAQAAGQRRSCFLSGQPEHTGRRERSARRLTSFSLRSRASLAASRWAAFLASSSSLNFSSCASNWSVVGRGTKTKQTQGHRTQNYRTEETKCVKKKERNMEPKEKQETKMY